MTLRDEVTHSLAPIQGSPELCLFELWGVDGDTLQAPDILGMVWPRRMKEKPGITREQLWPDALKEIADALQLLVRAVDHLSDLIAAVGVSRQPQRLYQDVHTLQVTVYDPRGRRATGTSRRPGPPSKGMGQLLAFALGVAVGVVASLSSEVRHLRR